MQGDESGIGSAEKSIGKVQQGKSKTGDSQILPRRREHPRLVVRPTEQGGLHKAAHTRRYGAQQRGEMKKRPRAEARGHAFRVLRKSLIGNLVAQRGPLLVLGGRPAVGRGALLAARVAVVVAHHRCTLLKSGLGVILSQK